MIWTGNISYSACMKGMYVLLVMICMLLLCDFVCQLSSFIFLSSKMDSKIANKCLHPQ